MNYTLQHAAAVAVIDTEGAYVVSLGDDRGAVLHPKQSMVLPDGIRKQRGGSHVCLPQFGPDARTGLPQHGYGRLREWRVVHQEADRIVLELDEQELHAQLTYQLGEHSLDSRLEITTENSEVAIAPAFHPYFAYEGVFRIDDTTYSNLDVFAGTLFESGERKVLEDTQRQVTISSSELRTWALWTDQLGDYICIEPTLSGNVFAEDMSRADAVSPDRPRAYAYRIEWQWK